MNSIKRLERILFIVLLLVHIIIIWSLDLFLTQDGPSHLYNSKLLLDLVLENNLDFYQEFFKINRGLFPNWFSSILLSSLLLVFKPIVAEKILVSMLAISFPLAIRNTILKLNRNSYYLTLVGLLFCFNYFIFYGFYNFCFSLVFFILFLGWYHDSRHQLTFKSSVVLALFVLLIYFSHPVALILLFLLIGFDYLIQLIDSKFKIDKRIVFDLLYRAMIILPSFILFFTFFLTNQSSNGQLFVNNVSLESIAKLITLRYLVVFNEFEYVVYVLLCILILILFWRVLLKLVTGKLRIQSRYILLTIGACLFMYFFINDSLAGGGFLSKRLVLFVCILSIIWLAQYEVSTRLRLISVIGLTFLSIFLVIARYSSQSLTSKLASEINMIDEYLVDHSVILFVNISSKGEVQGSEPSKIGLYKHLVGYLASKNEIIAMDNYEANTNYFPIRWQIDTNPYHFVLNVDNASANDPDWSQFDIAEYTQVTRKPVRYVLIWGDQKANNRKFDLTKLRSTLDSQYKLVFTSDSGLLLLYERL